MGEWTHLKVWSFLLAIALTIVAGWAALKDINPLFYLGTVGLIPTLLIEGVHGGGTHTQNLSGGIAFVVVNVLFYYFVLQWVLARIFGMRRGSRR